jgi:Sulfotransferase domain
MGGIVWLASYPKSGNTWTRNFLHNLLRPQADSHDINAMQHLTAYENSRRWFDGLIPRPLAECSAEEIAPLRPRAQERLAAEAPGLVFVKTHNALVKEFGHPVINSAVTAGAIYIVRHPLDVAVSFAHHLATTTDNAIEKMNTTGLQTPNTERTAYEVYGSWSEHVATWTQRPHQGLHIMRYEDMLAKPEATFRQLCDFLLLAPTRAALLEAIEKSSFERLKEQEKERGFFEKPAQAKDFFRVGRAGAWREHLTAEQVRVVMEINRAQAQRFGYTSN